MENKKLTASIFSVKKEKNIRIIGHSYTPEEVQPVADILTDSRGFFEEIRKIPDDKRDLMVLGHNLQNPPKQLFVQMLILFLEHKIRTMLSLG